MCSEISEVEWSGVLLYTLIGDFYKGDFKLEIKDIFPMHKGSAAYTEYDFDEDFIKYRMSNSESLNWEVGHVHSHNKMSTFFSGTDMSELKDNSENHNYYLSLIVNNDLEMTAKIAFIGEEESKTSTVRMVPDEDGGTKTIKFNNSNKDTFLFSYDCSITYEIEPVSESFSDRVDVIIRNAKIEAEKAKKATKPYAYQQSFPNYGYGYGMHESFTHGESFVHETSTNKVSTWLPSDTTAIIQLLKDALLQGYGEEGTLNDAVEMAYATYTGDGESFLEMFNMMFENLLDHYIESEKYETNPDNLYNTVSDQLLNCSCVDKYEDFILDLINTIAV